jgi:DNA-directed RNA polymerase specialized sigma24 family protein
VNNARVRLLIADALAQLSAEHRAVVRRSYYLGWTTAQIADDLQIAECTVKLRLHFALRALRFTLQRQPTRCALDASGRQQPAGPDSPGASGIRER